MYYLFYDPIDDEYIQVCFDVSGYVTHWTNWSDTVPYNLYPPKSNNPEPLTDWTFPIITTSLTLITPNSYPELFI